MADDPRGESSDRPTSPTSDGSTIAAGEIFKAIEPQAPPVAPSAQPHNLEAAAPKRAAVGRSMRVLAMIRRTKSAGLKAFVKIEETAPPAVEGMGDKPFRLEIPLDQEGTPQSAEIALTLDSPDFHPKSQTKNLTLPPGRDSELCTFLLTPKVAGELLLSLGVFKGEVLVASRTIRTVAEITKQMLALVPNVLVSIPLEVIASSLGAAKGAPFRGATWPRAALAEVPAPPPAPGAVEEKTLPGGALLSEVAKLVQHAEELPRGDATPEAAAPATPAMPPESALTPTVPVTQASAQAAEVTKDLEAEPQAEAPAATMILRAPLKILAQEEPKALEAPPPPPPPPPQAEVQAPPPTPAPALVEPEELAPPPQPEVHATAPTPAPPLVEPEKPASPPPGAPVEEAPSQAAPLIEGATSVEDAEEPSREIETRRTEEPALPAEPPAPELAPTISMAQVPAQATPLSEAPQAEPAISAEAATSVAQPAEGQAEAGQKSPEPSPPPPAPPLQPAHAPQAQAPAPKPATPRSEPKKPAPAPVPPRIMPGPPMKAKKEAPKKSPMLMVGGITLVVILVIGGYIFLHNQQPAGPGANQQVGTSNIPQPEQPEKTPAPPAQTKLTVPNPVPEAKAEFDAAVATQNRGDLPGALKEFQAIAEKPGTYQSEAEAHISKLNEMINNAGAQHEFNAALQAEKSGDLKGALAQFQAIAGGAGPFKADAQTHIQQINDQLGAAAAGQQFDAAAKVQNSGDLAGALALFKALAANPGPRQSDAQQRVQSITDQITQLEAQQQFNAAVLAQNSGDLKTALAGFKAVASKPSPLQPLAQAKADLIAQLLKPSAPPNPVQPNPAPTNPGGTTPTPSAGHNPVVTPLYSGSLVPLTLPYHKGMIVSDVNVDGGLKATNLAMPAVQGAPPGSLVLIMIKIDENGSVSPQRVINDTSGFGPQVQEAARAWKFNPPMAKGKPVNTTLTVKVTF